MCKWHLAEYLCVEGLERGLDLPRKEEIRIEHLPFIFPFLQGSVPSFPFSSSSWETSQLTMPLHGNFIVQGNFFMISSLGLFPWVKRPWRYHAQPHVAAMRRPRPRHKKRQQMQDPKSWPLRSHRGLQENSRSLHILKTSGWATKSKPGFTVLQLDAPSLKWHLQIASGKTFFSLCFRCLKFKLSLKVVF